jgi:hypothetical protein
VMLVHNKADDDSNWRHTASDMTSNLRSLVKDRQQEDQTDGDVWTYFDLSQLKEANSFSWKMLENTTNFFYSTMHVES